MDVSDARRLKASEDENAKLKRLLAEAMLDNKGITYEVLTIAVIAEGNRDGTGIASFAPTFSMLYVMRIFKSSASKGQPYAACSCRRFFRVPN
jgi:hypothetical protein